jgi:DNA-binding NtrC family response regulator
MSSGRRTSRRRCARARRRRRRRTRQRDRTLKEAREAFERAYILGELRAHEWNMTRTAEKLGIERSHLYRSSRPTGSLLPSVAVRVAAVPANYGREAGGA